MLSAIGVTPSVSNRWMLFVTQQLLPIATQVALFAEGLDHDAEVATVVGPVGEGRELRIGLARQVGVHRAERDVRGEAFAEVQRTAGDDVDVADRAAFDQGALQTT